MALFATWRHIKRLREVEDRLEAVERRCAGLDLEWSEASEELRTRLAKISKRAAKLERLETGESGERPEQNGNAALPEAGLSPTQAAAQREILARRRGLVG